MDDAAPPEPARKRTVIIAVAAAIVVVAAVAALVIARRQPASTYDDSSQSRFMDSCTADGGDPVRGTCQCIYDEIVSNVSYARFEEVSAQLRDQIAAGEPVTLPDDIEAFRAECVAKAPAAPS